MIEENDSLLSRCLSRCGEIFESTLSYVLKNSEAVGIGDVNYIIDFISVSNLNGTFEKKTQKLLEKVTTDQVRKQSGCF